jgi:hypothetical protein
MTANNCNFKMVASVYINVAAPPLHYAMTKNKIYATTKAATTKAATTKAASDAPAKATAKAVTTTKAEAVARTKAVTTTKAEAVARTKAANDATTKATTNARTRTNARSKTKPIISKPMLTLPKRMPTRFGDTKKTADGRALVDAKTIDTVTKTKTNKKQTTTNISPGDNRNVLSKIVKGMNLKCQDARTILQEIVNKEIRSQFPRAAPTFIRRISNKIRAINTTDEFFINMLDEIFEFLDIANVGHIIFEVLNENKVFQIPTDPFGKTFSEYIKDALIPQTARKKSLYDINTFKLDTQAFLSEQYIRFRSSESINELTDCIYDISMMMPRITMQQSFSANIVKELEPITDIYIKRELRLKRTTQIIKPTQRGGSNPTLIDNPYITVTDAGLTSSVARTVFVYYTLATDASILLNTSLAKKYRVRAGLRIVTQIALLMFNIACYLSVGELGGTSGRVICSAVNLAMSVFLLFTNPLGRNDIQQIRRGHAFKSEDNHRRIEYSSIMISFAAILAYMNKFHRDRNTSTTKQEFTVKTDSINISEIGVYKLLERIMSGNYERIDIMYFTVLRLESCKIGILEIKDIQLGFWMMKYAITETKNDLIISIYNDLVELLKDDNTLENIQQQQQYQEQQKMQGKTYILGYPLSFNSYDEIADVNDVKLTIGSTRGKRDQFSSNSYTSTQNAYGAPSNSEYTSSRTSIGFNDNSSVSTGRKTNRKKSETVFNNPLFSRQSTKRRTGTRKTNTGTRKTNTGTRKTNTGTTKTNTGTTKTRTGARNGTTKWHLPGSM